MNTLWHAIDVHHSPSLSDQLILSSRQAARLVELSKTATAVQQIRQVRLQLLGFFM